MSLASLASCSWHWVQRSRFTPRKTHPPNKLRGKPIKVRFTWSHITKRSARWEQAFSSDGGKTWEVNWEQRLERVK